MFNAGARFNRLRFNRPVGQEIDLRASVEAGSMLEASAVRDLYMETQDMDGAGQLTAEMEVEAVFAAFVSCGAELSAQATVEYIIQHVEIQSGAELQAVNIRDSIFHATFESGVELFADMTLDMPSVALFQAGSHMEITATLDAVVSTLIESGAEVSVALGIVRGMDAAIEAGGELIVPIFTVELDAKTDMEAGAELRTMAAAIYGMRTRILSGSRLSVFFEAVTEEVMKAEVTLNPGDILVIDTCQYTATLNGQNVIESIRTQLFDWLKITPNAVELLVDGTIDGDVDVLVNTVPRSL